ncbi:MAG TPA: YbaN family protein [Bacteroidales bacterium]|nr:YbaN family protein [Bacteroidales bacterium]
MSRLVKIIFIILGSISLILGIIGIFLPGLPTTPFLLLTAALYIRSSTYLYQRLINHRLLGKYIKNYAEKRGISLRVKRYSIALMWFMITISVLFLIKSIPIKVVVIGIGIIGTIVMGFVVRTVR